MRLTEKTYCGYDVKNRKLKSGYTDDEIFSVLQALGKLEDLLENLLKSKYIKIGFYIELDNPCVMILHENNKVLDWIDLDLKTYKYLQELLENE